MACDLCKKIHSEMLGHAKLLACLDQTCESKDKCPLRELPYNVPAMIELAKYLKEEFSYEQIGPNLKLKRLVNEVFSHA